MYAHADFLGKNDKTMTKDDFYKGMLQDGKIVAAIGEKRTRSRELDFGVQWRKTHIYPTYRVTWVENTGEVIAVNLAINDYEIIGIVPTEIQIEMRLQDWAEACGPAHSLDWVKARVWV